MRPSKQKLRDTCDKAKIFGQELEADEGDLLEIYWSWWMCECDRNMIDRPKAGRTPRRTFDARLELIMHADFQDLNVLNIGGVRFVAAIEILRALAPIPKATNSKVI
jgi:hypothetical protein